MLHLILVSPDSSFYEAAQWRFRDFPEVEVVRGKFEELPYYDCVITAGNSFGLMDAGMDLAVLKFFGRDLQDRIQDRILSDFLGEQPVGTSILVESGNSSHPWVAHSPTMRVPLNISRTDNVYLAFWATLCAIHQHNRDKEKKIKSVVCPGLGTGTGGMDPMEAALQIRLAYTNYLSVPEFINGSFAQRRHESVHYGSNWGFENPRSTVD
ncbi:MAG: phage tail protein [Verrucomicrobiales bacterium]|nr:phage tail protein [Verrucomicrobiales bacterium]